MEPLFKHGSLSPSQGIAEFLAYSAEDTLGADLRLYRWPRPVCRRFGVGRSYRGGVLGKLFGEVLEDVDQQPIESLQSTGASRLQILFYGILPQVLPQFISYTLYRWEVNIRVAAVLGFVGAGGLGQRIHIAMPLLGKSVTDLSYFYLCPGNDRRLS